MSAAAIALLIQLAPGVLQAGVPIVQGFQTQIIMQQQVQIAYYQATAAYWNAQRRCCCKVRKHK